MPSNFPATDDVFDVPSDPANTPLGDTGDGTRKHGSEHHRDIGDAIEAMQAQQTRLAHSHNGSTFRHGVKLAQANTHQSPDTDSATSALHHTVGSGANQGAPGDHTHDIVAAYPVGAFFFSVASTNPATLGFPGTWADVGQRFLVAQDGATFVAGATAGANTHSHTQSSVSTASDHSHTFSDTDNQGSHSHANAGSTNSSGANHFHDMNSAGLTTQICKSGSDNVHATGTHTHRSSSTSPSHSHSLSSTDSGGGHTHTVSSSGSTGGHAHTTSSAGSTSSLPPYLVVYMFKRTA